jgi:LuxR family transcriptional regulator, maltose regulon positive regulatory protein
MSTPILTTKLYIPTLRSKAVLRPRLVDLMNEGLKNKLTLISAPAGFGKTTLLSQWIASHERPVAWLSLDKEDNDAMRFLAYVISALQKIAKNVGEAALGLINAPQPSPVETVLSVLINEISAVSDNFILILDDYHLIEAESVNSLVSFLLERLPLQMGLVITTREDPALPLARLRVREQLTELRATDLRFTTAETADFLNRLMGLNLSAKDMTTLETRTEGWIAGLQLAAISMQKHKDTTSFIKNFTGSHQFVVDYLMEEVLRQQSKNVQTFLLYTSILDHFCASLCDAVLLNSSTPSQEILKYIENSNLFIIPLDNERRWYRYHHLFADLLRQRLQTQTNLLSTDQVTVKELHLRACSWYEEKGQAIEAIQHAILAKDFDRAANSIELIWPVMESSFQAKTWLRLVKLIPDEIVRIRPVLCAGYGIALIQDGKYEAGETKLQEAEQWLDNPVAINKKLKTLSPKMVVADEEQFRSLSASIANSRIYHAQALGDLSSVVKHSRHALELIPEGDYTRRAVAAGLLALSYWKNGDLEAAYQTFNECQADHQKAGSVVYEIAITMGLAGIKVVQGRLQEAVSLYENSIQHALELDESAMAITADLYLELSLIQIERGDLKTAEQNLLNSKELGDQAAIVDWQYRWCLAQAEVKKTQGDPNSAFELFQKAELLFFKTPRPNLRPVGALKARVLIMQNKLTEAQNWATKLSLSVDDNLTYLQEFEHITLNRILIAQYKNDSKECSFLKAMKLLKRLLEAAEEGKRVNSVIEILILQAVAYEAQGKIPLALSPLQRALSLAEPEGYVRIFVDEGIPMARLLTKAAATGIKQEYISKLISEFGTTEDNSKNKSSQLSQLIIEPLSHRELEVLKQIAQGLSNQEISQRLFLAVSTVKGHNKNIFSKLQVQRRTEAVARARELGLL